MKREEKEKMEDLLDAVWVDSGFYLRYQIDEEERIEKLKDDLHYLNNTIEYGYDYEELPDEIEVVYDMHWGWIFANYYLKQLYFVRPSELIKIYKLPKKREIELRKIGGMKLVRKTILEELNKLDCRYDFEYSANKCRIVRHKALWKRIITYSAKKCNLDYYIF